MDKLIAGKKIDLPGFILVSDWGYITHSAHELPDRGYITIMPYTLSFTVPETFNRVAAEVSALNKKIDQINDEHFAKVRQLKERIAELLCIENNPSGE